MRPATVMRGGLALYELYRAASGAAAVRAGASDALAGAAGPAVGCRLRGPGQAHRSCGSTPSPSARAWSRSRSFATGPASTPACSCCCRLPLQGHRSSTSRSLAAEQSLDLNPTGAQRIATRLDVRRPRRRPATPSPASQIPRRRGYAAELVCLSQCIHCIFYS
jgi:hypothetical protein